MTKDYIKLVEVLLTGTAAPNISTWKTNEDVLAYLALEDELRSAQERLRNEIHNREDEFKFTKEDVATLQAQVDERNNTIRELEFKLDILQGNYDNLKKQKSITITPEAIKSSSENSDLKAKIKIQDLDLGLFKAIQTVVQNIEDDAALANIVRKLCSDTNG